MLVEAFRKLPNLKSVGLHDHKIQRSRRLGEETTQRGYGWSLPGTGCCTDILLHDRAHHQDPESIFPLILLALSSARARPRSLILEPPSNLPADCLSVMSGPLARGILPVMTDLRHFRVGLTDGPILESRGETETITDLQVLLRHTPLLECLQLHFSFEDSMIPGNFVTWLSQTQTTRAGVRESVKLPFLTSLELGSLRVISRALLDVVSNFLTLVSVSFRDILLDGERSTDHVEDLWPEFLRGLADRVQCQGAVRTVSIHNPGCYRHPHVGDFMVVYFLMQSHSIPSMLEQGPRYELDASCTARSTSDVCFWLRELATRIWGPEDDADGHELIWDDPLSDQSNDEDDSDESESVASGRSNRHDLIERVVATTMYDFTTL